VDLEELKKIIKIFETSRLSELEIKDKGVSVRLCKSETEETEALEISSRKKGKKVREVRKEPEKGKSNDKTVYVHSPLVGTFYRAPSPDEKPFVEEGEEVTSGQTLCIIEAMKVMNEITSEVKGKVKKIFPGNGEPVEYDQKIFLIERAE